MKILTDIRQILTELKSSLYQNQPMVNLRIAIFRKIIFSVLVLLLVLCVYFYLTDKIVTLLILMSAGLMCMLSYYLAKTRNINTGTSCALLVMTLTTCVFMWRNEGIFDEALFAFSGFLIFAILVNTFAIAFFMFLFMAVNILLIGVLNEYGIYTNPPNTSNIDSAITIIVLLMLVLISVHLASLSNRALLSALETENKKYRELNAEIMRLQNHDVLTGLANRTLAEIVFDEHLKMGARGRLETSLLFIDLDNFKQINNTHGHSTGDYVLKVMAARLKETVRESDLVCRFGGDQFIVVATHEIDDGSESYDAVAEKLLVSLSQPISIDVHEVSTTVSIGIAIAPRQAASFDELYQKADLAMYAIKKSGRNNYQRFSDDLINNSSRKLDLAHQLRSAIPNNQFEVYFQSIHALASNEIVSAEALLRWTHPELGAISPVEFIPIAEQSGFISELGLWVLDQSLMQCKKWHEEGFTHMKVAVNFSAIQFARQNVEADVCSMLDKHGLSGECLIVELTESLLFDMQYRLNESIKNLRNQGVTIAIDDFGTGYSNLGYLHKTDVNVLKIDKSFVSDMPNSVQDTAIVETIINMGNSLSMYIIAEGVETKEVLEQLKKLGCDRAQGYLWTKPIDGPSFLAFMKKNQTV